MPRRKISKPLDGEIIQDLPELTSKQFAFVEGLISGKNATEAYKAAYDTTQCEPGTVWAAASRLASHPKIVTWITAARIAGIGKAGCSMEDHLTQLLRLREIGILTGNVGAAVQAEQLRGKASGHYTEKLEVTSDPQTIVMRLKELLPDVAELIQ